MSHDLSAYPKNRTTKIKPRCAGCKRQNRLLVHGYKVIEQELFPDIEPPVIACNNVPPAVYEYLREAYRAYEGEAYTAASMACRLVLDGFLHWCGFTKTYLADNFADFVNSNNPNLQYAKKQQGVLHSLKGIGDWAAHHQQQPGLVQENTAKGYLQIMAGILQHYEQHGSP